MISTAVHPCPSSMSSQILFLPPPTSTGILQKSPQKQNTAYRNKYHPTVSGIQHPDKVLEETSPPTAAGWGARLHTHTHTHPCRWTCLCPGPLWDAAQLRSLGRRPLTNGTCPSSGQDDCTLAGTNGAPAATGHIRPRVRTYIE